MYRKRITNGHIKVRCLGHLSHSDRLSATLIDNLWILLLYLDVAVPTKRSQGPGR